MRCEASLVIGILSGMLESLVLHKTKDSPTSTQQSDVAADELREKEARTLIRRLRKIVSAQGRLAHTAERHRSASGSWLTLARR